MARFKPDAIPTLNRKHPLARGLTGLWTFSERGGTTSRDLVGINHASFVGTTVIDPSVADGRGVKTIEGGTDYVSMGPCEDLLANHAPPMTLRWRGVVDSIPAVQATLFGKWAETASDPVFAILLDAIGSMTFAVQGSGGFYLVANTIAGTIVAGKLYDVWVIWSTDTTFRCFVNGAEIVVTPVVTNSITALTSSTNSLLSIGYSYSGTKPLAGHTFLASVHERAVTTAMIRDSYSDPWAILQFPRKSKSFKAGAAVTPATTAFARENAGLGVAGGGPFARANAGLGAVA